MKNETEDQSLVPDVIGQDTAPTTIVKAGSGLDVKAVLDEQNKRLKIIHELMKNHLKEKIHYGIIPGCKQKSLYKAGAEKINVVFDIVVKPVKTEDLSTKNTVRYRIYSEAYTKKGVLICGGVGECSSDEEKYKWRKPVCNDEFNEAPARQKREVYKSTWKNRRKEVYKAKQLLSDPATQINTILQMADKRSYVATTRKATAVSDIFTDNMEDLPPEYIDGDEGPPENEEPRQKPVDKTGKQPDEPGQELLNATQIGKIRYQLQQKQMDQGLILDLYQVGDLKQLYKYQYDGIIEWIKEYERPEEC